VSDRDQISSVLQRAVQEVISRGLNDPRVRGLISVTSVTISEDRREATVRVSVLPAEHAELTMHGLRHATPHVQSKVANTVRARRVPTLHFRLDESLKKQADVLAAIRRNESQEDTPAPEDPTT
jgi:ribosome-binding factor A